jgi:hypothetical protein
MFEDLAGYWQPNGFVSALRLHASIMQKLPFTAFTFFLTRGFLVISLGPGWLLRKHELARGIVS